MPARRGGLVMMAFWEDPEVKKLLQLEAVKVGKPVGEIVRMLLRDWLVTERKVRLPKVNKINKEGKSDGKRSDSGNGRGTSVAV